MPNILIVDDMPLVRKAIGSLLRAEGHNVVEEADAPNATAIARQVMPDAAILDIWIPGESGIELMRRLRSFRPELPVIIMSGGRPQVPLEYSLAVAASEGASAVLIKPFEDEQLLSALSTVLESYSP